MRVPCPGETLERLTAQFILFVRRIARILGALPQSPEFIQRDEAGDWRGLEVCWYNYKGGEEKGRYDDPCVKYRAGPAIFERYCPY